MSEGDSSGGNNQDGEDAEYQIVRTSTIDNLYRAEFELRSSGDAKDEAVKKLNQLARKLWAVSEDVAQRDERSTVQARDVEEAYQQILKPHNMLHQAVGRVEKIKTDLEDVANESPFTTNLKDE